MAAKGKNSGRDYKKEYKSYHGTAAQKKKRAKRNAAARTAKCPKGKEADHKRAIRKGGTNSKKNVKCVSARKNEGWRKNKRGYD